MSPPHLGHVPPAAAHNVVRHVVVPAHVLKQAVVIEEHDTVAFVPVVDPASREQGRVGRTEVRPPGCAD